MTVGILSVSLPSWERGLKFKAEGVRDATNIVAPFVGAWIEIRLCPYFDEWQLVAPFVGAWIEITLTK